MKPCRPRRGRPGKTSTMGGRVVHRRDTGRAIEPPGLRRDRRDPHMGPGLDEAADRAGLRHPGALEDGDRPAHCPPRGAPAGEDAVADALRDRQASRGDAGRQHRGPGLRRAPLPGQGEGRPVGMLTVFGQALRLRGLRRDTPGRQPRSREKASVRGLPRHRGPSLSNRSSRWTPR